MKYSYNWLQELSQTKMTPEEAREKLTMHSFEIEGLENMGEKFQGVITAKILEIRKHPNADKLQLVKVQTDEKNLQTVDVVCGAHNISVGDVVPLATVGTKMPNGLEIREAEIRGEKSCGMLCALDELGLGTDHSGIFILNPETEIGLPLAQYLGMNDWILEMKVLPDRGHDALSHVGVAREIAILDGKKMDYDFDGLVLPKKKSKKLEVEIKDNDLCSRYVGAVMENIVIKESPLWMKARLEASGIRAINNVVDATNYVMLELGQPLHAFDFEKINHGSKAEIVVRRAEDQEKMSLLDETEISLDENNLLITNGKTPLALAGIMGGKDSGIGEETKTVVLEAANFEPGNIRRTRTSLGLRTDSSDRFEKGIDPNLAEKALVRLIEILEHTAEGKLEGIQDIYPEKIKPWKIRLDVKYVNGLLGEKIPEKEVLDILHLLGVKIRKGKIIECEIPTYRLDLRTQEDLIEDIGRIWGYENINPTPMVGEILPAKINEQVYFERKLQDILVGLGFDEVYNYSFYGESDLERTGLKKNQENHWQLANPMNPDQEFVRANMLPNILKNIRENLKHFPEMKIFEIGKTYSVSGGMIKENRKLILAEVLESDKTAETFFSLKGEIEALFFELGNSKKLELDNQAKDTEESFWNKNRSVKVMAGGEEIGILGEVGKHVSGNYKIKNRLAVCILDLEKMLPLSQESRIYKPVNRFPVVERDISFFVDKKVAYGKVVESIGKSGSELLQKVELPFEPFEKEGKKSLTCRIFLGSDQRTLESHEIESELGRIISKLESDFQIEVRK